MLYERGAISSKPWEPIFTVKARPAWVQTTFFDLLRQLKGLRTARASLPSIDTLYLPIDRQLRVAFGDLDALCDSLDFVLEYCGALGVAYGGPDDRGTLWITFYKMLGEDRTSENRLQFIIWINSVRFPTITLEENIKSVYEHLASQTKPLETKVLDYYRQQAPHPPTPILPPETHGCLREERIAREYIGREYDEKPKSQSPRARNLKRPTGGYGRDFPDRRTVSVH